MESTDKNISLVQDGKNSLTSLYDKEIEQYITIIPEN